MRRTLITAVVVFALCAAVCLASAHAVGQSVDRADGLRLAAEDAARRGDLDDALALARQMAAGWRADGRWLELVTAHDALSEAQSCMADAALCLEAADADEFLRASAAVAAALERLRVAEAIRWMNLF